MSTTRTRLFVVAFTVAMLSLIPGTAWGQLTATDDTYVSGAAPTTANGSVGSLVVQGSTTNKPSYSYIRFDLSSLGAVSSAQVQKATLRLYVSAVTVAGGFDVIEVTSPTGWAEGTLIYNTAGASTPGGTMLNISPISVPYPSGKYQYILVDVTPAVQHWLSGTQNNGLVLKPHDSSISVAFASKEDTTYSHDPALNVQLLSSSITGSITEAQVVGLTTDLGNLNVNVASRVPLSAVGAMNGVAALDGTARVPTTELPSTIVYNNQSNTFGAGLKQIFQSNGMAGLNFAAAPSNTNPGSLTAGDIWFRLDLKHLHFFDGALTHQLMFRDDTIPGSQVVGNISGSAGSIAGNIPESQVTNLTSDLGTLTSNLTSETSARQTADTTLQNNINSEAATRAAADTGEATARMAADVAEASARATADTALQSNINTETGRATAAENGKASLAGNNTFTGSNTFTGLKVDLSAAGATLPVKTTTGTVPVSGSPSACVDGEMLMKVDGNPGQQLFICNPAHDGWVMVNDDAANTQAANTYTDTQVATEAAARVAGDTATLSSANAHADAGDATTLSSANAHSDAAVLAESVARAAGDANTLTSANTYTDAEKTRAMAAEALKANLAGGNIFTGNQSITGKASITGNETVNGLLTLPASAPGNSQPSNAFQLNATDNTGTSQSAQLQALADGGLSFEFGPTAGPIADKLSIAPTGLITFAPGQTFPGTNNGTVTQVDTGAGLTGGPISTTGTISIANAGVTNAMLQNSSIGVVAGTGIGVSGTSSLGGSFTIANTGALSFNGRNGLVAPLANDYSFAQLSGTDSATSKLVYNNQANTYTAGSKQTFKASATLAGLSFDGGVVNDPTTVASGDTWFNTTASHLKFFDGTTTKTLAFTTDIAAGTVTGTGLSSGQLIVGAGGSSIAAGNLTGEVTTSGTTATTLATAISSAHTFNNAANSFSGSGAGLTNLTAANISGGTAGINITGSASTITGSISGAQVTGNIAGNAANVTGTIAIANGGTGTTSAANARINLGAAASGANADITSMTAVTSITSTGTLTINGNGSAGVVTINGGDATGNGNGGDVVLSPGAGHGSGNPGQITIPGTVSGAVGITPQAAAGTPTLTLPNASGTFAVSAASPLVLNTTTGALTCPTCGTGSGTITSVTASSPLASSGGTAPNISLTGSVAIANGGTGQTNAAAARTALVAAASGANGDITSLTALTSVTSAVTMNNAGNSFTGTHSGNGAGLTALTAANISAGTAAINITGTAASATLAGNVTGTVAAANGGTGQTSYTDGQLLIGNNATGGLSKATLTAGSNVTITNGNGSITIAATAPSGSTYLAGASGGSVSAGATVFTSLAAQNATESNVQQLFPITATFTKFSCFGPKPTAGTSDVFTLRRNGANVAGATCTLPSGGTSVVTVSVSVTLNAGDLIDVQVANGNAAGGVTWALAP